MMIPEITKAEIRTEQLDCGVTRQWLNNDRLVVFTLPNIRRNTIDSWADAAIETFQKWNPEQRLLVVHDVSAREVTLTPYIRNRAYKIANAARPLSGFYSLVLPNTFASRLIQVFVDYEINRIMPNIKSQTFFELEASIAWVQTHLD